MNDFPFQGFSELEVNDFGPIVRAKVDLRPLTVFVGPSNTGKSYLAVLTYALHRFFSGRGNFGHPFSPYYIALEENKEQLSKRDLKVLSKWVEKTFADETQLSHKNDIPLDPVSGLIRSVFAKYDQEVGRNLVKEVGRCFGVGSEIRNLIRKENKSGMRIVFRKPVLNDSSSFARSEATVSARGGYTFSTSIPEEMPMRLDSVHDREFDFIRRMAMDSISSVSRKTRRRGFELWDLVRDLASRQLPHIVGPFHLPAFYLPADRTGVMRAHRTVVSALVHQASVAGLLQGHATPMLSGVLADFLQQLIELDDRPSRRLKPQNNFGERIEKHVLQGSVHKDKSESGYPFFTFKPKGWSRKLPLMNTSTMVTELAPVVLYLRHIVLPGNILIVEEPESHLHPAMQVEFTRQLAAVANSGIRIIITTHSEWLLEELANLVQLSKLPRDRRKKIDEDNVALQPDQVGAWLFEPKRRPKGSVVKEIPLDEESGLFPSGFGDVSVALYNKWVDIFSSIEEKR